MGRATLGTWGVPRFLFGLATTTDCSSTYDTVLGFSFLTSNIPERSCFHWVAIGLMFVREQSNRVTSSQRTPQKMGELFVLF